MSDAQSPVTGYTWLAPGSFRRGRCVRGTAPKELPDACMGTTSALSDYQAIAPV